MDFKVVIEKDEDGWYIATVPSLPGCISQGRTEEEVKENIADAIKLHIRSMVEDGIPIKPVENGKETIVAVEI